MLIKLHVQQGCLQMLFQRIKTVENEVVKVFLTHLVPYMFNRIQLGGIRRQPNKSRMLGSGLINEDKR